MSAGYMIVGNGPAGCLCASRTAREHDTVIVGQDKRRVQCAGLISSSGLERIGVDPKDTVLNEIRGARVFSPGGVSLEIDSKKTIAYALDRGAFDQMLLDDAVDAGAQYVSDWVTSLMPEPVLKNAGKLAAENVVLASGTDYSLHHLHSLEAPTEFLVGGQYEMRLECDPSFVELYFNLPDFFSWVIPLGDTARVGLCVKGNPRRPLDAFVKKLRGDNRILSDDIVHESFGIIPVHRPGMRTQYPGLKLVGDCAGQVKASTGGGIVLGGMASAHILSDEYERLWRRDIERELRIHLFIHRFINRLSDGGKDRFFRLVADNKDVLESIGDMDMASATVFGMAKNPRVFLKSALALPGILLGLI